MVMDACKEKRLVSTWRLECLFKFHVATCWTFVPFKLGRINFFFPLSQLKLWWLPIDYVPGTFKRVESKGTTAYQKLPKYIYCRSYSSNWNKRSDHITSDMALLISSLNCYSWNAVGIHSLVLFLKKKKKLKSPVQPRTRASVPLNGSCTLEGWPLVGFC